jgi:hypothetical protein
VIIDKIRRAEVKKNERFAIINYIVDSIRDLRKTQIQKLVYFLQYIFGIPLDYGYKMHYFGPYSDELNSDLINMRSHGYINIDPDPEGYGYHITPGTETLDSLEDLKKVYVKKIDTCLRELAEKDVKNLELLGAIHFVTNVALPRTNKGHEVIDKVRRLKPSFSREEIENAYKQLEELEARVTKKTK